MKKDTALTNTSIANWIIVEAYARVFGSVQKASNESLSLISTERGCDYFFATI